jgi:histidinol-phosphatase (PHP family)
MLPADGHVHTEWSWDALSGSMERSCQRAMELGVRSIAFTEHSDFTAWTIPPEAVAAMPPKYQAMIRPDGTLKPPLFNVEGYFDCLQRCRDRFRDLRILSGLELGEPHWHGPDVADLLRSGEFERVIGSVHSLRSGHQALVVDRLHGVRPAEQLMRDYLAETVIMIQSSADFDVLGHLDYPLRGWSGTFKPEDFEEEFRAVLRALARSGRGLEINSVVPMPEPVVRWWRECGGRTVCFGSDAHEPGAVARDFAKLAELAESQGFRPGEHEHDLWRRR